MNLTLSLKKKISFVLWLIVILVMFNSDVTIIGIWVFGILAVMCSLYYAYLVCRYDLMDNS